MTTYEVLIEMNEGVCWLEPEESALRHNMKLREYVVKNGK